MADNSWEFNKHIGRTALILLLLYIMVVGFVRVRNQSIMDSVIVLVDDEGKLAGEPLIYEFTLSESYESMLNITVDYNRVNNDTQAVVQIVKWDNVEYDTWLEAKESESMVVGSSIISITPPMGLKINKQKTLELYSLSEGSWVVLVAPYTRIGYKIKLYTLP